MRTHAVLLSAANRPSAQGKASNSLTRPDRNAVGVHHSNGVDGHPCVWQDSAVLDGAAASDLAHAGTIDNPRSLFGKHGAWCEPRAKEVKPLTEGKDLIAYCGLYCGDCFGHRGTVADLARDLRKELRQAHFAKIAESVSAYFPVFKNYKQCYEVLGALVRFRCKNACKGGGGPPFCKIRKCCQKKGVDGCWQCDEFETCEKLDFLEPGHGDAHRRNLKTIRQEGVDSFLSGKKYW